MGNFIRLLYKLTFVVMVLLLFGFFVVPATAVKAAANPLYKSAFGSLLAGEGSSTAEAMGLRGSSLPLASGSLFPEVFAVDNEPTVTSGQAGDNIWWEYDELSKTLRFTGSGQMWNYERLPQMLQGEYDANPLDSRQTMAVSTAPWGRLGYNNVPLYNIQYIEIDPAITSIGDNAFFRPDLSMYQKSVQVSYGLNSQLLYIGEYAFSNVPLTAIDFSEVVYRGPADRSACEWCSTHEPWEYCGQWEACQCCEDCSPGSPCELCEPWNPWESQAPPSGYKSEYGGLQIGSYAFENIQYLYTVDLGEAVTVIGLCAFQNCYDLQSFELPESLRHIGGYAFAFCSNLMEMTIPTNITYLSDGLFYYCGSLKTINLHDAITTIGSSAFQACGSLQISSLPDSVDTIKSFAFSQCRSIVEFTIPQRVTAIEESLFYSCSGLKTINLHDDITSIGSTAFYGCYKLEISELPQSVESIGSYAFYNCSKIVEFTIPEKVKDIANGVFGFCANLKNIILHEEITSIGKYSFQNCTSLLLNELPETVKTIDLYAFSGCAKITISELPAILTTLGAQAFSNCSSLTQINIPEGVKAIENYVFSGCTSLTTISLHEGITSIGSYAFNECVNLQIAALPSGITDIGSYAFNNCSSITLSELPEGLTVIPDYAFSGCAGIQLTDFPNGLTAINQFAFAKCDSLSDINLPAGVQSLPTNSFANITDIYIVLNSPTMVTAVATTFNASEKVVVFVPEDLLSTYKENSIWKSFTEVTIYPIKTAHKVNIESEHGTVTTQGSISRNSQGKYRTDEEITISVVPYEDCIFTGWSSEDNIWIDDATAATTTMRLLAENEVTITANFVQLYNLTVQTTTMNIFPYNDGGSAEGTGKYTSGTTVDIKAIANEVSGYEFIRWDSISPGGIFADATAAETTYIMAEESHCVIVAVFGRRYTVTFDYDDATGGHSIAAKTVISGDVYRELPSPTKEDYNFMGWYTEPHGGGTKVTEESTARIWENQTLYAYFTPVPLTAYQYEVEHIWQDSEGMGYTVHETQTFQGYKDELVTAKYQSYPGFIPNETHANTKESGAVAPDGSLTLKLYYDRNTYTVTYASEGELYTAQTGIRYGAKAVKPTDPVKSGFTFSGWYLDKETCQNSYNFDDEVRANVDLYAKWSESPITFYTLTVRNSEGGTISPSTLQVEEGNNQTFTVTPNKGYIIADVLVDGLSVGAVKEYTFKDVKQDYVIEAKFNKEEHNCPALTFSDLDTSFWYHSYIDYVLTEGIMVGTQATLFSPNEYTTRAQLVSVLARIENVDLSQQPATQDFKDVPVNSWCASAIHWAATQGIVYGYGNGNFAPNGKITREQFVAIIYRYLGIRDYESQSNLLPTYSDAAKISNWALESMEWAVDVGLIVGYSQQYIAPQGFTTRAEMAAIIQRLQEEIR